MGNLTNRVVGSNGKVFFVLLLLGLVAYFNILGAQFKTMDDFMSIIDNPHIKDVAYLDDLFKTSFFDGQSYYRPLVHVSYMVEYHLIELRPFFYNLTNILLHVLVAMGVFLLVTRILQERKTGLIVALLFVLHPVQAEAVGNIPGRSILLCAFFFIYAFLCFQSALEDQRARVFRFFLAVFLYILSLLSKESAVMLPFILMSYLYFFPRSASERQAKRWLTLIPFFVVTAVYFLIRQALGITNVYHWLSLSNGVLGVCTFLKACFHYIYILLLPLDLYYDHSTLLFENFRDPYLWGTLAVWGCVIFLLVRYRKKISSRLWFFISWIALNLVTVSQIVPIRTSETFISSADHFLYLPSIGAFVVLVLVFRWLFEKARQKRMVTAGVSRFFVAGVFIFLLLTTIQHNTYSRQEIALFKRTLAYNPENTRVRTSLATVYAMLGLFEEAEVHYREALKHDPTLAKARLGLGTALADQERYWESIAEYEKIQNPGPLAEMLEENLSLVYKNLINKYLERLSDEPDNPDLYYSLGVAYSKSQQLEEGIRYLRRAIDLNSRHKNALFNLGSDYALLGNRQEAIQYYERVLALPGEKDDLDVLAYLHLGQLHQELGYDQQAGKYFRLSHDLEASLKGDGR